MTGPCRGDVCMIEGTVDSSGERSFLLTLLAGGFLGVGGHLLDDDGGGVQGLLAVGLGTLDAAVGQAFSEEDSGDGAHHLELLDEVSGRDVPAELGDDCEISIVGCLVKENCIIGFFFDFSLGPFLNKGTITLAAGFFLVAALEISALPFFTTALGMWL